MSDSLQPITSLPPKGWYPDPRSAGREKWWDGSAWTEFTHRPPRASLFGPDYVRRFWPGANRAAWYGILFSRIGAAIALVALGYSFNAGRSGLTGVALQVPDTIALALLPIFGVVGLFFGIVAVRRASRLGAIAVSIQSIYAGALCLVFSAVGWRLVSEGIYTLANLK